MAKQRLALDTSVLLDAMSPTPRDELAREQRSVARSLMKLTDRYDFVLPAPVLFEALVGLDEDKRPAIAEALQRQFYILPADARVAEVAVRGLTKRDVKRFAHELDRSKQAVKIDWLIAACAIVDGASLCTRDPGLARHFKRSAPQGLDCGDPTRFLDHTNIELDLDDT